MLCINKLVLKTVLLLNNLSVIPGFNNVFNGHVACGDTGDPVLECTTGGWNLIALFLV